MNPSIAIQALDIALGDFSHISRFLDRKEPTELPKNGAFKDGGKMKGRATTRSDHRAFEKRVAKRRAKKGYR